MKYAFCNESFEGWELRKVFDFLVGCGYEGVELAPFSLGKGANVSDYSAQKRVGIRRMAENAGIEIVGLHWLLAKTSGFHLTSPDEQVRMNTARYLCELAQFCADIGGSVLVFGSPKERNLLTGVTQDDAFRYACDVLQQVVDVLKDTGVTLALEPLAEEEATFLNTASDALRLIEMVNSDRVRLHLDCKAVSRSQKETASIQDLVRQHHGRLAHFHANDPNLQGPGVGNLDFVPIIEALNGVGYEGWVSVEVFDYSPGVERLARKSIEYMKRCLAEIS